MFHVGQKVVCVNVEPPYAEGCRKGLICTISAVKDFSLIGQGFGLQFEELAPTVKAGWLPWFAARNWRPVVERPTSIEVFKALLTPKPADFVDA